MSYGNYDYNPFMEEAGSFHTRNGSIRVQVGYREHLVTLHGKSQPEQLKVPEFLRLQQNNGEPIDIPMGYLEAFLGLVNGSSRELRHRRRLLLHDMVRLGITLSGGSR